MEQADTLARLVRRALDEDPRIVARSREPIPPDRLRGEYGKIRAFLTARHGEGDLVALYLEKDYLYLLTILACIEVGMTFIPLRVEWPLSRVDQIQRLSGFKTLLTDELIGRVLESPAATAHGDRRFDVSGSKALYVMFTSGSTGEPKGVIIERKAYENFVGWVDGCFHEIGPDDRVLCSTDFTFDVSFVDVALLLTRKPAVYMSDFRDDIFRLLKELDSLQISVIATVPNNLSMILTDRLAGRADLSHLKHVLVAGSRFTLGLWKQIKRHLPGAQTHNCYGPTEATIYCIVKKLAMDEQTDAVGENVSIGTAIPGCIATLRDAGLNTVPRGEQGDLYIGGVQIMRSYVNPSARTDSIVEIDGERFYRTGDVAFQDDRGEFYVVGRSDDTLKVAGQRTNLSDVDAYVQRLEYIRSCATIAVPDPQKEYKLFLYVVLATPKDPKEIQEDLRGVLLKHQLPQRVEIMEQLPLNNSGKIDKKALLRRHEGARTT